MERKFLILPGISIVIVIYYCMVAKNLGLLVKILDGAYKIFIGLLFKILLKFGFKSHVIDVSAIMWRKIAQRFSDFFANEIFSKSGVPRWQSHRRSGLATLPSVGAVP